MNVLGNCENGLIYLEIDGVKVTGKFDIIGKDLIRISMISPYEKISEETCSNAMVVGSGRTYHGDFGSEVAMQVLANLYLFIKYTIENETDITNQVKKYLLFAETSGINSITQAISNKEKILNKFNELFLNLQNSETYTVRRKTFIDYILASKLVQTDKEFLFSKEVLAYSVENNREYDGINNASNLDIPKQHLNTIFEILYQGVPITGILKGRNARLITIEMTSPYSGLSGNSGSIPLMASAHTNFLGEYGVERATQIITNLYLMAKNIEINKLKIAQDINTFIEKVIAFEKPDNEINLKIELLTKEKTELHKKLKAREMNSRQYQKLFSPIKKAIQEEKYKKEEYCKDLFEKLFEKYQHDIRTENFLQYLQHLSMISQDQIKYFKNTYF